MNKVKGRYLDMVDDPSHVKKLTMDQLLVLAEEIRQELGCDAL